MRDCQGPQPAELAARLLPWFDRAKRDLPWRRTGDPHRIWVAEVMLQQTRVTTVVPYYERFLAALPDVRALAAAPLDVVLGLWAGLGYYSRVRNLHQAARAIVERHDGRFPEDYHAARALPGVGEYTAGAVLSIAYRLQVPALDGNAFRVLARVFGVRGSTSGGPVRQGLVKLGREAVPPDRPGDYNQALMEQGSQVCLPRQPRCANCCLGDICRAWAQGLQESIPQLRRAVTKEVAMVAALVLRRGRVLLAKRPPTGVWGGLWELPNAEGDDETLRQWLRTDFGLTAAEMVQVQRLTYGIMDWRVTLTVFLVEAPAGRARSPYGEPMVWVPADGCASYALPAPHRRVLTRLREQRSGERFVL